MQISGVLVHRLRRTNPPRAQSPTHVSWSAMVTRCFNVDHKHFAVYGGRGITVCERWLHYENFVEDMGERPPGTSIDRIDGDGDYEPGNCRWATKQQQQNNLRSNRYLTIEGRTQTVAEWARERGLKKNTVYARLFNGWSAEDALKPLMARAYHPRRLAR